MKKTVMCKQLPKRGKGFHNRNDKLRIRVQNILIKKKKRGKTNNRGNFKF